MSYGRVAAFVRKNKEAHPERYCSDPRCLWALRSGPCPKHNPGQAWVVGVVEGLIADPSKGIDFKKKA